MQKKEHCLKFRLDFGKEVHYLFVNESLALHGHNFQFRRKYSNLWIPCPSLHFSSWLVNRMFTDLSVLNIVKYAKDNVSIFWSAVWKDDTFATNVNGMSISLILSVSPSSKVRGGSLSLSSCSIIKNLCTILCIPVIPSLLLLHSRCIRQCWWCLKSCNGICWLLQSFVSSL